MVFALQSGENPYYEMEEICIPLVTGQEATTNMFCRSFLTDSKVSL